MLKIFFAKIKQFKNLILLCIAIAGIMMFLLSDPLGYFAVRSKYKAQIINEIAIARAETEKKIALIRAETEAEIIRIKADGKKTR